jgi:hypothetical protein
MNAVGDVRLLGLVQLKSIYNASFRIGETTGKMLGNGVWGD